MDVYVSWQDVAQRWEVLANRAERERDKARAERDSLRSVLEHIAAGGCELDWNSETDTCVDSAKPELMCWPCVAAATLELAGEGES